MKNDIYKQVKTVQKLEQEIVALERLDRIKRKGYGQNFVIRKIKGLVNDLNLLILGKCKYGKENYCLIEKAECNVVDKENCIIKIREDQVRIKEKVEREQKKKPNVFIEVEDYKKLKGDTNER